MERIVVGVDGSDESKKALHWAAEAARLRKGALEIVTVYSPPFVPRGVMNAGQIEEILNAPVHEAEQLLQKFAGEVEGVETVRTYAVANANPAHALIRHSREAAMLVVSARGLGAFRRLVLGSVSQQVAQHAECPVVIIRPEEE